MFAKMMNNKKDHLSYKINYFASVMFRTMTETNNFIIQIKEK